MGLGKKAQMRLRRLFQALKIAEKNYEIVSREIEVNLEHRGKDLYVHKTYGEVEIEKLET